MENYEKDILDNLVTEWATYDTIELSENLLELFGGMPRASIENNWALVMLHGATETPELVIGFGECGGNGKGAFWDGTLYWSLSLDGDSVIQSHVSNGSALFVFNSIFSEIEQYLETKGGN